MDSERHNVLKQVTQHKWVFLKSVKGSMSFANLRVLWHLKMLQPESQSLNYIKVLWAVLLTCELLLKRLTSSQEKYSNCMGARTFLNLHKQVLRTYSPLFYTEISLDVCEQMMNSVMIQFSHKQLHSQYTGSLHDVCVCTYQS